MNKNTILLAANAALALFFIIFAFQRPIYIFDGIVYLFFVLLFWRYGKSLDQTTGSMSLIFLAEFLHNLGVFGVYTYVNHYDKFMHFLSGIAIAYALLLFLSKRTSYRTAVFFALIGALGIGAIGEISEYSGYALVTLSPTFEGGLLDPGISSLTNPESTTYTDTMTDLISGLMGSVTLVLLTSAKFLKGRPKKMSKRG